MSVLNLATVLRSSAAKNPNAPAFSYMEKTVSYGELDTLSNQVAQGLMDLGLEPGDKVGLSCPNIPYFPVIYFGILKAGMVVVPLSILLKNEEIAFHLSDSDARAYFCFEGTSDLPMYEMGYKGFAQAKGCEFMILIESDGKVQVNGKALLSYQEFVAGKSVDCDIYPAMPADTCVIIYTSGTTGRPKGAELSHSNLLLNAIISADLFHLGPADRSLIVLPLFHIFAMTCLMNAGIYRGCQAVLLPRFEASEVFRLMEKYRITVFAGVPTMYWGLLHCNDPTFDYSLISSNLRVAASGGAALPVKVLEAFEDRFRVKIQEGYGMSEGSPVVTFNQLEVGTKPGSIGTPVWGVDVMLVDEDGREVPNGEKGELLYRGHNVMKGYYKKPDATAETLRGGWLHSGDVAIRDDEGYYFIVDRTKDMIIRGGLNVYPREVEEVMMHIPGISLVAVIGIPDEKLGEEIKAFVVRQAGAEVSAEDIIRYTKEHLAAYKYPRLIEFVESLPMSATGKILKKELRKQFL